MQWLRSELWPTLYISNFLEKPRFFLNSPCPIYWQVPPSFSISRMIVILIGQYINLARGILFIQFSWILEFGFSEKRREKICRNCHLLYDEDLIIRMKLGFFVNQKKIGPDQSRKVTSSHDFISRPLLSDDHSTLNKRSLTLEKTKHHSFI